MFEFSMPTMGTTQYPYPVTSDTWIFHEWERVEQDSEYELQFGYGDDYSHSPMRTYTPFADFTHLGYPYVGQSVYIQENGFFCRRVKYNTNEYLYLGCFHQKGNPEKEPPLPVKPVEKEKSIEYILPSQIDHRKDILPKESVSVLGVTEKKDTPLCTVDILKRKTYELEEFNCELGISVESIKYSKVDDTYILEVDGIYGSSVKANVNIYVCEDFNILKPKTWFRCSKYLSKSFKKDIELIYTVEARPITPAISFIFNESSFSLRNIYGRDIQKEDTYLIFNIYFQVKDTEWIDVDFRRKISLDIPEVTVVDTSTKPFLFPLDRLIGVTQWYGCTKYQCPHNGIDFGARLNGVVAVADGTVFDSGWDSYDGTCNQGGNFLILKHSDGMYSTYFHLDHYLVKKGDSVKKNQKIAVSGNTGKWNCQSLGYHLHFGTKKNSTHVNPVEYVSVDWNRVPTIGKDIYPKRLSGENPHPNF